MTSNNTGVRYMTGWLSHVARGEVDRRRRARGRASALRGAARRRPFEDLGFARVDHHRAVRQGFPEVILGLGKTPTRSPAIAERIVARGQTLLVTRADEAAFDAVSAGRSPAASITMRRVHHPAQNDIAVPGEGTWRSLRRHVRPAGRGRSRGDRRGDGQHGRPALRRRRRRPSPPASRTRRGSARPRDHRRRRHGRRAAERGGRPGRACR